MNRINIKKFGFAMGAALAVLHVGCVLLMSVLSREAAVFLANSLIHGTDFTSIARMDVPAVEVIVGLFGNFIVGWIAGTVIALVYNTGLSKEVKA